jgi:hypothetical protein
MHSRGKAITVAITDAGGTGAIHVFGTIAGADRGARGAYCLVWSYESSGIGLRYHRMILWPTHLMPAQLDVDVPNRFGKQWKVLFVFCVSSNTVGLRQ